MTLIVCYLAVKLLVYVAWCRLGVSLFRPLEPSKTSAALKFGLFRLLLGLVFGTAVFLWVWTLNVGDWKMPRTAIYFLIYAPLRWVEWSIIGFLLQREPWSLVLAPRRKYATSTMSLETAGARMPGVLWKLGGIAVSHLADLPLIVAQGGIDYVLPIGRFLC